MVQNYDFDELLVVLDQVASGMDWESITEEWNGNVTAAAIREAVELAARALAAHVDDFVISNGGIVLSVTRIAM